MSDDKIYTSEINRKTFNKIASTIAARAGVQNESDFYELRLSIGHGANYLTVDFTKGIRLVIIWHDDGHLSYSILCAGEHKIDKATIGTVIGEQIYVDMIDTYNEFITNALDDLLLTVSKENTWPSNPTRYLWPGRG